MDLTTGAIRRIIPHTFTSRMSTLNLSVLTMPKTFNVEAVAPLPGLGLADRVSDLVRVFDDNPAINHLIIGGAWSAEKTYEELSEESLRLPPYGLTRTDGNIITIAETFNTYHQVDWLMQQIKEQDISSVLLGTSAWHLVRAFGTAINAAKRHGLNRLRIYPFASGSMDDIIPESLHHGGEVQTGKEMVPAEIERIKKYTRKGDVADYSTILSYVEWVREQHKPQISAVA